MDLPTNQSENPKPALPPSPPSAPAASNQNAPKPSAFETYDLKNLLLNFAATLNIIQLYKISHPLVKQKIAALLLDFNRILTKSGRVIISSKDNIIFINGYQEKSDTGPLKRMVDTLKSYKVASFEFQTGVTDQEINTFFDLMGRPKEVEKAGDIKTALTNFKVTHIKPIFLQYVEVDELGKEVPKPVNTVANATEEQQLSDFLTGKTKELPDKMGKFILSHPKLAALVLLKLLDEYKEQGEDGLAAFKAFTQSLSHYLVRMSRILNDPEKASKSLEAIEKNLLLNLKSLNDPKRDELMNVAKEELEKSRQLIEIQRVFQHYISAKLALETAEKDIIKILKNPTTPQIEELKAELKKAGFFHTSIESLFS